MAWFCGGLAVIAVGYELFMYFGKMAGWVHG